MNRFKIYEQQEQESILNTFRPVTKNEHYAVVRNRIANRRYLTQMKYHSNETRFNYLNIKRTIIDSQNLIKQLSVSTGRISRSDDEEDLEGFAKTVDKNKINSNNNDGNNSNRNNRNRSRNKRPKYRNESHRSLVDKYSAKETNREHQQQKVYAMTERATSVELPSINNNLNEQEVAREKSISVMLVTTRNDDSSSTPAPTQQRKKFSMSADQRSSRTPEMINLNLNLSSLKNPSTNSSYSKIRPSTATFQRALIRQAGSSSDLGRNAISSMTGFEISDKRLLKIQQQQQLADPNLFAWLNRGNNNRHNRYRNESRIIQETNTYEKELHKLYEELTLLRLKTIKRFTPEHIDKLKKTDPVFAKRHKQYISARVCMKAPMFDQNDYYLPNTLSKTTRENLKREIIRKQDFKTEMPQKVQIELQTIDNKVKNYLKSLNFTTLC